MINFFLYFFGIEKQDFTYSDFKIEAIKRIKNSAKISFQVLVLSIIVFVLLGISIAVFGEESEDLLITANPFTSGLLHAGIGHLLYNLLLLFVFTLPSINSHYNIKKLYIITVVISCLYLPISLLGITQHAIGISGTCYFLMIRFSFNNRGSLLKKILFFSIVGLILLGEYINMKNEPNDGVAHGVHFLGAILGILSLYFINKFPKQLQKIF